MPFRPGPVRLLALSLVLPVLAALAAPAAAADTVAPRTITVAGNGSASVRSDIATFSTGASVRRDTAADAISALARRSKAITDALRDAGVKKADIGTAWFTLSPAYDYGDYTRPARLVGFDASQGYSVTVRGTAAIGAAIDAAVRAGATSIDSISFSREDAGAAAGRALAAAVADARARAEAMATAAGVGLGEVLAVSEGYGAGPMPPVYAAGMGDVGGPAAETRVMPAAEVISATVTVVFAIGEAPGA